MVNNDSTVIPGYVLLFMGVLFPLFTLGFEVSTSFSGTTFINPIPSVFHILIIAFVGFANLYSWFVLRGHRRSQNESKPVLPNLALHLVFNAAAIAISIYYTLLYAFILPFSLIGIVFFGIGLLPFAPLLAFIASWRLRRYLKYESNTLTLEQQQDALPKSQLIRWSALVFCTLIILDTPNAATQVGLQIASKQTAESEQTGLTIIRLIGSEKYLINKSYSRSSVIPTGLPTLIVNWVSWSHSATSQVARKILYQTTGKHYTSYPNPNDKSAWGRGIFDADLGGDQIGATVDKLVLVSSKVDTDINLANAYTYTEWTFEVQNNDIRQREARFLMALPEGGVVSRVTLWVQGEPKEAAFNKTSKVKQAYQSVVRQRLDPFLVTTAGPGRNMLQAFPVPPRGGIMKFKIGVTSPLMFEEQSRVSSKHLRILSKNFLIDDELKHTIWAQSDGEFTYLDEANDLVFESAELENGAHRLVQNLTTVQFASPTFAMFARRGAISSVAATQNASVQNAMQTTQTYNSIGGRIISQSLQEVEYPAYDNIMLVIDGSAGVADKFDGILNAISSLSEKATVNITIAGEEVFSETFVPGTAERQAKVRQLFEAAEATGGFDNARALASALIHAENKDNTMLLWIHGSQPINFRAGAAMLEQVSERLSRLPSLAVYSMDQGDNKLFKDPNLFSLATQLNKSGNIEQDLRQFFEQVSNGYNQWEMQRTVAPQVIEDANNFNHPARLWAFEEVNRLIANKQFDKAGMLAQEFRLVTSVSGAVVLETKQQYDENDLTPEGAETVPHINSPNMIVLFVMASIFLLRRSYFGTLFKKLH